MQQHKINKDFRVLLGDIFIVPFLGPALVYWQGNVQPGVGKFGCIWLEWFARGQEIWLQIFVKSQIPTPFPAPLPHPPALHW